MSTFDKGALLLHIRIQAVITLEEFRIGAERPRNAFLCICNCAALGVQPNNSSGSSSSRSSISIIIIIIISSNPAKI